jgi:GntR family transcriptional regulator
MKEGLVDIIRGGPAPNLVRLINRKSSEPVYLQLVNSLRQKIKSGEYLPGEKLPSESMLVELYQVSPMTVNKAINTLISQHVVTTARGSGTYVKEVELGTAKFYLKDLKDLFGDETNTIIKVLDTRYYPADERISRKLQVKEGERTIHIERLLFIEDKPVFYHRGYLVNDPHRPIIEAELEVTDLKGLFQGSGSSLVKYGDLALESTILDHKEAGILKLESPTPGMKLEYVFFDFEDKPINWGWFVCESSQLRLHTRVGIK